jgi:hypothetical protein
MFVIPVFLHSILVITIRRDRNYEDIFFLISVVETLAAPGIPNRCIKICFSHVSTVNYVPILNVGYFLLQLYNYFDN